MERRTPSRCGTCQFQKLCLCPSQPPSLDSYCTWCLTGTDHGNFTRNHHCLMSGYLALSHQDIEQFEARATHPRTWPGVGCVHVLRARFPIVPFVECSRSRANSSLSCREHQARRTAWIPAAVYSGELNLVNISGAPILYKNTPGYGRG